MRIIFGLLMLCCGLFFSCTEDETASQQCLVPTFLSLTEVSATTATFTWQQQGALTYNVVYKLAADLPENEFQISVVSATVVLNNLLPNANYEVRVQAICDSGNSQLTEVVAFTTEAFSCQPPSASEFDVLDYNEVFVDWNETGVEISWEIEYGLTGFDLGTGVTKPASISEILLDALIVGTTYDYYVKSYCELGESEYSEVQTFTTEACEIPTNVEVFNVSSSSVTFHWNAEGQEVWEFEYGLENFELGSGTVLFTETIPTTIEQLDANTHYEFYIRANCGPNGRSEYVGPILVETLL